MTTAKQKESAEDRKWAREQAARDKVRDKESATKAKGILEFIKKHPLEYRDDKGVTKMLELEAKDLADSYQKNRKYTEYDYTKGEHREFKLYYTERFGWVLTTLPIQSQSRGYSERTYGIVLKDGELARVGAGPHVLKEVLVYRWKNRATAMQPLTDLFKKGLILAHENRDDLSTARAGARSRRRFFSF